MSLAALIFDVDGTLADTEEAHRGAFNDAFAEAGLPWQWSRDHYAELLKTTGGKERIAAHVHALEGTAADHERLKARIPEIHRLKTVAYTRRIREGAVALRPGVRRLLAEARAAGLRLAIASTTSRENIDALLTATLGSHAPRWFEVIEAGDTMARKKPASDVYDAVLLRLGLAPDACVAFEDSGRGLAAAKGAALFTVVTPTTWTRDDNFAAADVVLASLGDPEAHLTGEDAALVGHPMLRIADLERLHASRDRDPAKVPLHLGRSTRAPATDGASSK